MTQEFQVSVTPVGVDEYLVRTERVEPGVPLAEEQAVWHVDRWMQQARPFTENPIAGLLKGKPTDVAQPQTDPIALGQALYNALFHGDLRDSWMMAQAIAQNHQQPLRLRLGLKGNRLPALPWEILHDGDYPLATGTNILFSRYHPSTNGLAPPAIAAPLSTQQPLRVLMAISAPSDRTTLQLAREAEDLEAELERASEGGSDNFRIAVTTLRQPDRARLTQALEHGRYQIFHYAGHSNSGAGGGKVSLVNQATGLTEDLSGDDLAGLLANNGIQMVVFNSCRGAHSDSQKTGDRSLAAALVKRGIPAVLAMAERIPDEVALTLTRLFYRNLMRGYPIDLSISRARQGLISAYSSHQLYWSLPVFYLHPRFDGYLTHLPEVAGSAASQPPVWVRPNAASSAVPPDLRDRAMRHAGTPPPPNPQASDLPGASPDSPALDKPVDARLPEDTCDEIELGNFESGDLEAGNLETGSLEPADADDEAVVRSILAEEGAIAADRDRSADRPTLPDLQRPDSTPPPVTAPAQAATPPTPSAVTPLRLPKWLFPAAGAALLVLVGAIAWATRDRRDRTVPTASLNAPSPQVTGRSFDGDNTNDDPDAYAQQETTALLAEATSQFSAGDVRDGAQAVAALLAEDRNAVRYAKQALDSVPSEFVGDARVAFLRGRVIWQMLAQPDLFATADFNPDDYTLADVRGFWNRAIEAAPNTPAYRMALGFAWYAEDNWDGARDSWDVVLQQLSADNDQEPRSSAIDGLSDREVLSSTYAGLALVFYAFSQDERYPELRQADFLETAATYRERAFEFGFQPQQAFASHWIWTPEAIADWGNLSAELGRRN